MALEKPGSKRMKGKCRVLQCVCIDVPAARGYVASLDLTEADISGDIKLTLHTHAL